VRFVRLERLHHSRKQADKCAVEHEMVDFHRMEEIEFASLY
jgi:hypothetical protein